MTFIRFGNLFSLSLFLFFSFLSSRAPLQVAPLICCRHGQLSRRGRCRPPGSLEALIRSFLLRGKACLLRRPFGGAAQGVRVMFSLARSFPRPRRTLVPDSRMAVGEDLRRESTRERIWSIRRGTRPCRRPGRRKGRPFATRRQLDVGVVLTRLRETHDTSPVHSRNSRSNGRCEPTCRCVSPPPTLTPIPTQTHVHGGEDTHTRAKAAHIHGQAFHT